MKLLLLSGGMDSVALAWQERPDLCLTIDYGQLPAAGEIRAASAATDAMELRHEVLRADCRALGSGDLAGQAPSSIAPSPEWWPFRNQLLITLAAMRAAQVDALEIIVGAVATDSFHADGSTAFFARMNELLALQEGGVQVRTPAIQLSSVELIRRSGIAAEVLAWAHSCHKSDWACGACRGCLKQLETRIELGHESH